MISTNDSKLGVIFPVLVVKVVLEDRQEVRWREGRLAQCPLSESFIARAAVYFWKMTVHFMPENAACSSNFCAFTVSRPAG